MMKMLLFVIRFLDLKSLIFYILECAAAHTTHTFCKLQHTIVSRLRLLQLTRRVAVSLCECVCVCVFTSLRRTTVLLFGLGCVRQRNLSCLECKIIYCFNLNQNPSQRMKNLNQSPSQNRYQSLSQSCYQNLSSKIELSWLDRLCFLCCIFLCQQQPVLHISVS